MTGTCENRQTGVVLSTLIDAVSWDQAIDRIRHWAGRRESRYVCITNAHSVVTATREPDFGRVLEMADLVTPDGAPVAWMLRRQGFAAQERINGPDLMWRYCSTAAARGEVIFLYGGTRETLDRLQKRLTGAFPGLTIGGAISPPFRPLSSGEDAQHVEQINASGAGTVWVGLGCPKQERWMATHKGRINAVMVGVGAAFDYHAGTVRRAPLWMQRRGLEWLHRLTSEPSRLWKRYLVTNTLFVAGAVRQLLCSSR